MWQISPRVYAQWEILVCIRYYRLVLIELAPGTDKYLRNVSYCVSTDIPAASKCSRCRKDGAIKIVRNSYTFPIGEDFNQSILWPRKVFCKSFCSWVGKHVLIGWKMQGLLFLAGIESSSKVFVPHNQRTLEDNTMNASWQWCTTLAAPFLYN